MLRRRSWRRSNSVDRQSFRDIVIIAVDDGSTDSPPELLNAFAELRPNVIVLNHTNHGAAYSRNRGIRYARDLGIPFIPFIAFLDADDVWHQDKLAWQMRAFELYPDADIVVVRQEEYERIGNLDALTFDESRIRVFERFFETDMLEGFRLPSSQLRWKDRDAR